MHTAFSELIRYIITIDQLDPTELVAAEFAARQLVLLEAAVDRNPKSPDWEGLDIIVSARIGNRGKAEVVNFQQWLSTTQQATAQTLKQGRLLREERAAEAKRRGKDAKPTDDT